MNPRDILELHIEKPVAGGRMLARHDGQVVLVAGAIPGETVRVRVERVERSLAFATVEDVLDAHAARRVPAHDPRCGGNVYAHIAYPHQLALKGQVIRETLARIGRLEWPETIPVTASAERGYRMRARLHVRDGRPGFFIEGTHQLCDAAATGQLLDPTVPAVAAVAAELVKRGFRGDADVDVSENIPGDQRAIHIEFEGDTWLRPSDTWRPLEGVTGLSCSRRGGRDHLLSGEPVVTDTVDLSRDAGAPRPVTWQRHVRSFFQGNRYVLPDLVRHVIGQCPPGSVLDLYAGVGLFGIAIAAAGGRSVVAVEGHPGSASDLRANARPHAGTVEVHEAAVEAYLASGASARVDTVVLDPPRSGMTAAALAGVLACGGGRVVFVSCDVATMARDLRRFLDAGYRLERLDGFDLFPNTAHVEVVALLVR